MEVRGQIHIKTNKVGGAKENIARIANAVQCQSLLSGHHDCNVFMFSLVRNVNNFIESLELPFAGVL